jgi:hypothetical protein
VRILHRAFGDFDREAGDIAPVAARPGQNPYGPSLIQQGACNSGSDETGGSGYEVQTR